MPGGHLLAKLPAPQHWTSIPSEDTISFLEMVTGMNVLKQMEQRLALPGDSETLRSQKTVSTALMFVGGSMAVLNFAAAYVQGLSQTATVYLVWIAFVFPAAFFILAFPRTWKPVFTVVLFAIIPAILAAHVFSGGFQYGLGTAVWLLQVPIGASLFLGGPLTIVSLILYIIAVIAAAFLEPFAQSLPVNLPLSARMWTSTGNLIMMGVLATAGCLYLLRQVDYFRTRADNLLLNLLPAPIISRLKESPDTIADSYPAVSVLFADVVGSTPLFTHLEPGAAVDWLNDVFTMFDRLAVRHQLEKIRTIGDGYMVASGAPTPRSDHAHALADFALEMVRGLAEMPPRHGQQLAIRVGIQSGPVVAGVIGRARVHYDLWGDTVNIASRMESHGEPGKIQIGRATYELIRDDFDCIPRGIVPIKGKGEMETWFLLGRKLGPRNGEPAAGPVIEDRLTIVSD